MRCGTLAICANTPDTIAPQNMNRIKQMLVEDGGEIENKGDEEEAW